MSDMRKKVEDAYTTNDHPETYLLGVALSLLGQAGWHVTDYNLLCQIEQFRAAIEAHQRAFYDGLRS